MVNVCERWATDRTDGLQSAFFNGVGYESWENVWGVCNQFTPRDAEALRRIATIERAMADLLVSPDWEPHVPTLQQGRVRQPIPGEGQNALAAGQSLEQGSRRRATGRAAFRGRSRYYDLWNGVELKPAIDGQTAKLAFPIEARGYGAVLAVRRRTDARRTCRS